MKQTKKADNKSANKVAKKATSKPKLVKKKILVEDTDADDFLVDLPKSTLRNLYWNMAVTNFKSWIKSFF
jgi:hypothetical protein